MSTRTGVATSAGTGSDLDVHDLRLDYGDTVALDGLSLHVPGGTLCGLLGRNGSGKTSLLSLVASLGRPTGGEIRVDGRDPFEDRELMARIALVGEAGDAGMYRVKDALALAEIVRPTWDDAYARRLLERFAIPPRQRISKLPRGKRAALGCICGLAARAPVTMFDEPHLGMDVPSRYAFYDELLSDYMAHPRTIILSTHHIDEVASLFGQVVIIDRGRLVVHDDTDALRERGTEVVGPAAAVDRFARDLEVLSERSLGGTKAAIAFGELSDGQRRAAGDAGLELNPIPLQDLFLHLTEDAA